MLGLVEITPWHWAGFILCVLFFLALDLGLFNRHAHVVKFREAAAWSALWFVLALGFAGVVAAGRGREEAIQFTTGYIIELSLSMDNVFVIALIFAFFRVPSQYQHRVLFWGILGVIALRGLMIGLGVALLMQFSWVLYLFGAFLLLTGIKMLFFMQQQFDLAGNPVLRLLRRRLRVTPATHGHRFWVRLPAPTSPAGPPSTAPGAPLVWWATPLFLALVLIEFVDLVFAVDSIPAIFAVTQNPFIVYTSNIFAILGLRALYFALAALIHRFHYLKYALALVLIFIGGKILTVDLVGKMPAWISLTVTFGLLLGGVLYSLWRTRAAGGRAATGEPVRGGAAS
jgi:tellurite resistance protein TerC